MLFRKLIMMILLCAFGACDFRLSSPPTTLNSEANEQSTNNRDAELDLIRELAKAGDSQAQFKLAIALMEEPKLSTVPDGFSRERQNARDDNRWREILSLLIASADAGDRDAKGELGALLSEASEVVSRHEVDPVSTEDEYNELVSTYPPDFVLGSSIELQAKAIKLVRESEAMGSPRGQYVLSDFYRIGFKVDKDLDRAFELALKAADQGEPWACFDVVAELSGIISKQFDKPNDDDRAETIAEKCISKDEFRNHELATLIGHMHMGREASVLFGTPRKDYPEPAKALKWYKRAADFELKYPERSDGWAMVALGKLFDDTDGVMPNYRESANWYRRAAIQGNYASQRQLAESYLTGHGVPVDFEAAYFWSLVSDHGTRTFYVSNDNKRFVQIDPVSELDPDTVMRVQDAASQWRVGEEPTVDSAYFPADGSRGTKDAKGGYATSGSGFLVSNDGHIVTNQHVVEDCTALKLSTGAELEVVASERATDLALLRGKEKIQGRPLPFRRDTKVNLGQSVFVGGFPMSGELAAGVTVTSGNVSAVTGIDGDRTMFQLTAPIQKGNSGGAVVDETGNVVGVVVAKLDAVAVANETGDLPQNVNFAVSPAMLQAFLADYGVKPNTPIFSFPQASETIAKKLQSASFLIQCH